MKYMGSKARIANKILPIMLANRTENQWWVEPFVGGGNMIDKVTGNRLGADLNHYAIEALEAIRDNLLDLPKNNTEFTEEDYRKQTLYKGYIGFALSYGGKWMGGWRRDSSKKRDYVAESYRAAVNQSKNLQGVKLVVSDYRSLEIPPNSLVYCDSPYKGTTKYKDKFDHADYWQWCRDLVSQGHTVFVSEYAAPEDFKCVWQGEQVSSLTKDTGSKRAIERLFTL